MTMTLSEAVGQNLDALCRSQNLTQAELGRRLGRYLGEPWSRQAVSAAVKGRRAFAVTELMAIALTLEVRLSALLEVAERIELPGETVEPFRLNALLTIDPGPSALKAAAALADIEARAKELSAAATALGRSATNARAGRATRVRRQSRDWYAPRTDGTDASVGGAAYGPDQPTQAGVTREK